MSGCENGFRNIQSGAYKFKVYFALHLWPLPSTRKFKTVYNWVKKKSRILSEMKKLLVIGFLVIVLTGCNGNDSNLKTPTVSPPLPVMNPVAPTATLSSEEQSRQLDIQRNWENSAHARTDNIVSCSACHQLENGLPTKNISWWNEETGQYQSVGDGNVLCQNCHAGYQPVVGAHTQLTCLDCHDQHSTKASCFTCHKQIEKAILDAPATPADGHPNGVSAFCEGSGCHATATQVAQMPFSLHGSAHAMVTCVACHDADGLKVGPLQDGSGWVLWREIETNGEKIAMPYQSHDLQFEVDCARCHFEQNPWDLSPVGSNGYGN